MEAIDINQKKEENNMDIQSPYIKSSSNSIEEVRKRITKRAMNDDSVENDSRVLSFKNEEGRPESDDIFRQKVANVSKRIVGEEIRKFAEIASREIGKEFGEMEMRLNENIKSNVLSLQDDINKKIEKFNYSIKDLEDRIRDLEILSIGTIKKEVDIKEPEKEEKEYSLKIEKAVTKIEKEESVEEIKKEEPKKEEIINSFEKKKVDEKKEKGSNKDVNNYYATTEAREEEEKYITNKIKDLVNSFEKSGLLFRKNSYVSVLKNLVMEEFLNKKDDVEYKKIDSDDKEKIYKLLTDLMDTLNIDPNEDEKIEEFIKRAYRIDFQETNSK